MTAVLLVAAGCGGSAPTAPGGTAGNPPASAAPWVVRGVVRSTVVNAPIAGATLVLDGVGSAQSDTAGSYSFSGTGTGDKTIRISAPGFLDRQTTLRTGTTRSVDLDLISTAPPFSLDFYRQIARNAAAGDFTPLRIWSVPPNFYIRTTEESGDPVPESLIEKTKAVIRDGVAQWSGGRLTVGTIETGPGSRIDDTQSTWVNVYFRRRLDGYGNASIGPGSMNLRLVALNGSEVNCREPDPMVARNTIIHEVGHVMGMRHTIDRTGRQSIMSDGARHYCVLNDATELDRFHASIMYSRSSGNTDADNDASTTVLADPVGSQLFRLPN